MLGVIPLPQEMVDMTDRELETSFGRMRLGLGVTPRKLEEVVVGVDGTRAELQVTGYNTDVFCYCRLHYLQVQQSQW